MWESCLNFKVHIQKRQGNPKYSASFTKTNNILAQVDTARY